MLSTPPKPPRDNQRSRVYNAEQEHPLYYKEPDFKTVQECQEWYDELLSRPEFIDKWGERSVLVKDGRGSPCARAGGGMIDLPRWARKPIVMCHELAHIIIDPFVFEPHGEKFVKCYLWLIDQTIGGYEKFQMEDLFAKYRVKPYRC